MKTAIPVTSTFRCPKRSPRAPEVNIKVAKTKVYEPVAHCNWAGLAPSPRTGSARVSKAVVRMVLSSQISSEDNRSTARINCCLDFGNVGGVVMGTFDSIVKNLTIGSWRTRQALDDP